MVSTILNIFYWITNVARLGTHDSCCNNEKVFKNFAPCCLVNVAIDWYVVINTEGLTLFLLFYACHRSPNLLTRCATLRMCAPRADFRILYILMKLFKFVLLYIKHNKKSAFQKENCTKHATRISKY